VKKWANELNRNYSMEEVQKKKKKENMKKCSMKGCALCPSRSP
jgi:hypothetical protein